MAKVQIDRVLAGQEFEIRKAVKDTLEKFFPEMDLSPYDIRRITSHLIRRIDYRTSKWVTVPDQYVDAR